LNLRIIVIILVGVMDSSKHLRLSMWNSDMDWLNNETFANRQEEKDKGYQPAKVGH